MTDITYDQLKEAIDSGAAILADALPAEEYAQGHLPGAVSIPAEQAAELAPSILPDKNAHIITYCGSSDCPRSKILAEKLQGLGYTDVSEYRAGKKEWVGRGLPLEEGVTPPPAARPVGASAQDAVSQ